MKIGTRVIWDRYEMPGQVVDERGPDIQIAWEEGYKSILSGGTFWSPKSVIAEGFVSVVGTAGADYAAGQPMPLVDSFQLAFEGLEAYFQGEGS